MPYSLLLPIFRWIIPFTLFDAHNPSRLPVELRLAGISDIREANIFLNHHVKEYNAKFTLPIDYNKSVFVKQPETEMIHQTLAVLSHRVVDSGHSIRYENKYYRILDSQGLPVYYHQGTKGLVICTFTKELLFSVHDKVYMLEEIPEHERVSKNFDFKPVEASPKKRYIPSPRHPWRDSEFLKHVGKPLHPNDLTA